MQTFFFESDRLWFRAPEPRDAPLLQRWINHPEARSYLDGRVFPLSQKSEEELVSKAGSLNPSPPDVILAYGLKDQEEVIGVSGLHRIHWISRQAEWGILINPNYWNQGFGKEVCRRMLKYGFEELNLNRIYLRVSAEHKYGIRCYQSVGYQQEGILRQAHHFRGQYQDMIMMSVLAEEYFAGLQNPKAPAPQLV